MKFSYISHQPFDLIQVGLVKDAPTGLKLSARLPFWRQRLEEGTRQRMISPAVGAAFRHYDLVEEARDRQRHDLLKEKGSAVFPA